MKTYHRRPLKRRSLRKKYHKKASRLMVYKRNRTISPFPPQFYTTLAYSETIPLLVQATADLPEFYTFRLNSLFDPNLTGVGIQPRYFDTLLGAGNGTAPYRQYRVHGAKITATFWPTSATASIGNGYAGICVRRSNVTIPATITEMRERPYVHTRPMYGTNSGKPIRISSFVKMKKILGNKDLNDNEDSLAQYNANPVDSVLADILICNVQGSSLAQMAVEVKIQYFCQLSTLNDVADS